MGIAVIGSANVGSAVIGFVVVGFAVDISRVASSGTGVGEFEIRVGSCVGVCIGLAFHVLDPHNGSLGGVHGEDQFSARSVVLLGGFQEDDQLFVLDVAGGGFLEYLDLADLDLLDFAFAALPFSTNTNTSDWLSSVEGSQSSSSSQLPLESANHDGCQLDSSSMFGGTQSRAQLSPRRRSPPPVLLVFPADHWLPPPTDLPHLLVLDDNSPLGHPLLSQPSINCLFPSDPSQTTPSYSDEFSLPLPARAIKPIDMASMEAVSTASVMNVGSRSRCRSTIYYYGLII